jgi:phosphonate degradation associated HDIG domain protein
MRNDPLDLLRGLFETRGAERYESPGDAHRRPSVSQLEHALQCATLAEAAGADEYLVSAALLHDLGHLVYEAGEHDSSEDDFHQFRALPLLRDLFPDDVLEPIKLHVDAKRYLCATEPSYHAGLSAASKLSLALQGGAHAAAEADAFIAQPFAREAVLLRRWDDRAKVIGLETPGFGYFARHLRQVIVRHS